MKTVMICGKRVRLILASQSPRRFELLTRIGLEPEVIVSGVPEKTEETKPDRVVMDLSRQKAEQVAHLPDLPLPAYSPEESGKAGKTGDLITVVIGADTVVCVDGRILGKPHSHREAEEMIRLIAGRTHQVYSGVTLFNMTSGRGVTYAEKTDVTVSRMTEDEISAYAFSSEPMDKAGAYGIQGFFGRYIERISGDYSNVVGLPAGSVYQRLKEVIGADRPPAGDDSGQKENRSDADRPPAGDDIGQKENRPDADRPPEEDKAVRPSGQDMALAEALQAQITPHFLTNTLELIKWAARMNKTDTVSTMVEGLSSVLRNAMNRGGSMFTSLREEMESVDGYLSIAKQKYGDGLKIVRDIDETLLDRSVPKMILQPIAENALCHGTGRGRTREIRICIREESDSRIVVEIKDDGKLTEEDQRKIRILLADEKTSHPDGREAMGIRNVNRRLKILCGQESGLDISSDIYGCTVSRVIICTT